ncbi:MAG: FAD-binding oxidoreductase [Dehalococcoidia bacterium]|nr:FAD-binding oxidoreductase [Dehalococcoidia bacterium]
MKKTAEVIIIGGGISGCTIAYNLSKENVDTVLVEKGSLASGATGRSGSMIWNIWGTDPDKELAKLGLSSTRKFAELEEELGYDIEYTPSDYLTIVTPEEEEHYRKAMAITQKNLGLHIEYLKPDEIKKIAPYIDVDNNPVVGAYHLCNHRINAGANPFYTVEALITNAKRAGAKIYTDTEVTDIEVENGKIEGILTTKGKIKTHTVINAAGAWSSDVAKMAGIKIPTMPYRDEAFVTEPLMHLPYLAERGDIWWRQEKNGQIIAGEETHIIRKPEYNAAASLGPLQRPIHTIQQYIPQLGNVNILRHWGGFEDVTPDKLPIVGEVDELKGLILACGCDGFGFSFSQAHGKLITDLIVRQEKSKVMEYFNLRRFARKYREYTGRWYDWP